MAVPLSARAGGLRGPFPSGLPQRPPCPMRTATDEEGLQLEEAVLAWDVPSYLISVVIVMEVKCCDAQKGVNREGHLQHC